MALRIRRLGLPQTDTIRRMSSCALKGNRRAPWFLMLLAWPAVVVHADTAVTSLPGNRFAANPLPVANQVVVHKGERRLELWRGRELLRSYRISLGLNPDGHKQQEGDFRTPEGRYRLNARNPRSDFFLSLAVSYPDKADVARARQAGVAPGGAIMIHGLPNQPKWSPEHYAKNDWTDGCIALSNADMMEVWMLVPTGTPIDIRP
jgi:lipoprotein-anchoring transpeptidase ErfK/SrfK